MARPARFPLHTILALVLGAAFGSWAATPALGQDPAETEETQKPGVMEEVRVTGTRIKRIDLEIGTPLTVIDRDMIENSGYATVSELVRASAFNSFGSYSTQSGFEWGRSGAAFVDLRGLGPENTLVLLNGRRFAPFPGMGAEMQDINQIPMDAVERIEILRDGASAIYGSDAISGVVNIITRKDMRDIVGTLQVEDRDPEGGESGRLALTGGYGSDRGNVTFSLEHFRQEPIDQQDIPRLADPTEFGELNWWGFPSMFMFVDGPFVFDSMADPRCPSNQGESEEFPDSYRFDWENWEPGSDWQFSSICGYNYAPHAIYLPKVERNSLYLDGRFDLTADTRFVGRALYYTSETDTRYPAMFVSPHPMYMADNPNNPIWLFVGQTITDPGLEWYVPGGTYTFTENDVVDVVPFMRMVPNGPRDRTSEHENWSLFAGLEGDVRWLGGAQWDLGAEYASSRVDDTNWNLVFKPAVQEVIDSGELDLFNVQGLDHDTWLANTTAAMQKANHTGYYFGETRVWTIDGKLSFDGFQWGSGLVPFVVGLEYSDLDYSQGSDPETEQGLVGGNFARPIDSAQRDITTIYAETLLPLGSHLELNLAARYDHYSDFGGTTNPKVSLAWRPGRDWLLRGSWGTGFKAPTMLELYQPRVDTFGYATDHVGCENGVSPCAYVSYPAVVGGNPDLEPHESESWTAGVVWSATDRLVLELTWYDIEYTNSVGVLGMQDMFDREYEGLSHGVVRYPDGRVNYVEVTRINLSGQKTSGIDFSASYALTTERAGLFDFTLESTWPQSFEWEAQEGDGFEDFLDWLGYPKNRANFMVNWTLGAFQATWVTYYTSDHGESEGWCWPSDTEAPCEEGSAPVVMDDFWSHDLQLAWNASWNGQFAIGARNLFNEDPPYHECCMLPVAPYEADWNLYDPTGRTIYLRYRHEF